MSLIYCFKSTPTTPPHPHPLLHSPDTHTHTLAPFFFFSTRVSVCFLLPWVQPFTDLPSLINRARHCGVRAQFPRRGRPASSEKHQRPAPRRIILSKCFLIIDSLIMNKARCLLAVRRKEEIRRLARKQPSGEVEQRPGSLTAE